jgi:hypothetical protein
MMEGWQIGLIVLAGVAAIICILWQFALWWACRAYGRMIKENVIEVDDFVGGPPSSKSALKCLFYNWFSLHGRKASSTAIDLRAQDSDKVPGLKVTTRSDHKKNNINLSSSTSTQSTPPPPPLVVGTIRMGFGHHRIAYAATSWGIPLSSETYFHDLLNIDSEEATLIKNTDQMYSKFSRMASEWGGPVEKLWGSLTLSGDADSLRATCQMAHHLRPVIAGLDKRSPIIATHCLVAAAAVEAGFPNVINLVIDNHAQWFTVVPGALNLVQGPTNYHNFLKMGVPPSQLQLAGHWIPKDLVDGIPTTCQWRIDRANASAEKRPPLRIIIPVGGAGAQRKFVTALVAALAPLVKAGKVQLFLNAGDHKHMKEAFENVLEESELDYTIVPDMAGVYDFAQKYKSTTNTTQEGGKGGGEDEEPPTNVTLFAFDDYFTAVATTDILCEVSDVLACKPSELAFYPIPKLMIRRVGDHELYSALRASELGDGTLEAREVEDALKYIDLFLKPELLTSMNMCIIKNNSMGIYNGCKNAVRIALERAEEMNSK